jgi:lysophospholipase L1-like esterase
MKGGGVRLTLFACLLLASAALGSSLRVSAPAAEADPALTGYPDSMAALGDSITRAANITFPPSDYPDYSWATGTNASVQSIYSRILLQNPLISGNQHNDAVSGARMVHLNGQAVSAVSQGVQLVTILMGANDVCTSSEATMTPVATFQSQLEQALATLSAGLPDARIAIGSIPDIYNLWAILKDNSSATATWGAFSICQSMLANPLSTAQADVDRRNNVRQRNMDFNTVLENVCAQYVHCRFDNNAGFNTVFTPAHVSTLDYFHPSVAGQALAANVGWGIYDLTDAIAPVSSATSTPSGGGISVTLSATDHVAVSGIEYKINGGAYQRYTVPVNAPDGSAMTFRAVDISGNIEATQCLATPDVDTDCAPDTTDNCPGVPNPGQENVDGDGFGDACDSGDSDSDSFTDQAEYFCWSLRNDGAKVPERIDGTYFGADDDGDTQIDEALPGGAAAFDCDGDGFAGSIESAIGTEPQAGCPDPAHGVADGWPLDNNANGVANVSDVIAYKGKMPGTVPPQPKRLDLDNNNSLNVSDVLEFKGKIPSVCN